MIRSLRSEGWGVRDRWLPRGHVPAIDRPVARLLVPLAAVSFVAHMLVAGNYGYFRDELYYIADG